MGKAFKMVVTLRGVEKAYLISGSCSDEKDARDYLQYIIDDTYVLLEKKERDTVVKNAVITDVTEAYKDCVRKHVDPFSMLLKRGCR